MIPAIYFWADGNETHVLNPHFIDPQFPALNGQLLGANKSYGIVETYYFVNSTQRKGLGQAFAREALSNSRLKRLNFWITPDAGGHGINLAYPFEMEDYLPPSFV